MRKQHGQEREAHGRLGRAPKRKAESLVVHWGGFLTHWWVNPFKLAPVDTAAWTVGFVQKLVGEDEMLLAHEASVGCHWLGVLRSQDEMLAS